MTFEPMLRTDILTEEQTTPRTGVFLDYETQYNRIVRSTMSRSQTPMPAKDINEVMELIKWAVEDYHSRENANEDARVNFLYEEPDKDAQLETISVSIIKRLPGTYGQGAPFENKVKNLKPILREETDDPDNKGYRRAILGYFFDNILQLTCWARTNKQANARALWLEEVMLQYDWFFAASGVGRFIYWNRGQDQIININNNKVYGRPIQYFVRTEKLRAVSQKQLEQIYIKAALDAEVIAAGG